MTLKFQFGLKRVTGSVLNFMCLIDHLSSSSRKLVISVPVDLTSDSKPYLLYATFTKSEYLLPSELFLLNSMKEKGWNILIVSNSQLKNQGIPIIIRKNRGRDLGAYRDGLEFLDSFAVKPKTLLLLNSSIIVNPNKIDTFIDTLGREILEHDMDEIFSAMTFSYQHRPHVQTYFLLFHNFDKHADSIFSIFKKVVRNWRFKRSAVYFGEKKLLNCFEKISIKPNIFLDFYNSNSFPSYLSPNQINPSIFFWKEILESNFSFLKRNIVSKKNQGQVDIETASKLIMSWERFS